MRRWIRRLVLIVAALAVPHLASADPIVFSTGNPDGLMAMASRPASPGKLEIETADDFVLTADVVLTQLTFTGLITSPLVTGINLEVYNVFPTDSTNPPSGSVPTRVNSPSDDAIGSATSAFSYTMTVLNASFTAANSVLNGIHPIPNQTTGGEGPVTGTEVLFTITPNVPFAAPAGHYFFVPQVSVNGGEFYWLSAPRPIVPPGTPFAPDLQAWIRNGDLDPDWLRVGTDIVGGASPPTFNAAFSLTAQPVPEPSTLALLLTGAGSGLLSLGHRIRQRRRRV